MPPPPPLPFALVDLPEHPQTPPSIKNLTSNFEHHPSLQTLPLKRHTSSCVPGAFTEAFAIASFKEEFAVPLVDAVECAFLTSVDLEPTTLADALTCADANKWIEAALAEIEAHIRNGTWVLTQLPPGRRAIGLWWVFKVKRLPDGSIDKYKGCIIAQGFSQVHGIHYNKVFAPTARMVAMRLVIALAAIEDLELETVDIGSGAAAFDGVNVIAGRSGILWNAALRFFAPDNNMPTITVRARATLAGNVGPMMALFVGGTAVGSVEVRSTTFADHVFTLNAAVAPNTRVDVVFTNDGSNATEDRNLYVESLTVNNATLLPTNPGACGTMALKTLPRMEQVFVKGLGEAQIVVGGIYAFLC